MSVVRIGEFQATPQSSGELNNFLLSILPIIKSSEGCEAVQLYQSREDPTRFTMIEIWDSVESHQASVKNIPPQKFAEIRPLLGAAPAGGYFELVAAG